MRFEGGSRGGILICSVVLFFGIFAGAANSATVIYSNTDESDYVDSAGAGCEMLDYGTSDGGVVKSFTFKYYAETSSPGRVKVRFYQGTSYYTRPGSLLKTFTFYGLPGSSYGNTFTKSYTVPTNEQFMLESGSFGYSVEFSDSDTYCILTGGGTGNENNVWMSYYDWIWDEWDWERVYYSSSDNPHAGTYMVISADPPPEPTRVCGYKFDDADGDGEKDAGEDVLEGWRIYIDANGNGTWDSTEPNDITDPNGYYEFLDLPAPDTIIVAEVMQDGWTQTLPGGAGTYQLSIVEEGQYTNKNFGNTDEPVVADVTISGYVLLSDGRGLEMVQINPLGAITGADGYYSATVESGWSGILSAVKPGWVLSDPVTYTNITTDQTHDFTAYWPYSGGTGTEASPLLIATPGDLNMIGLHPEDYSKHFELVADIDLSSYTGAEFNLIGYFHTEANNKPFSGVFEGNGHTISNFSYTIASSEYEDSVNYLGLFNYVDGPGVEIKNVGMINPNLFKGSNGTGAIAGMLKEGTIDNCWVYGGSITSHFRSGGLVGQVGADGIVTSCFSSNGTTYAKYNYAGGFVGENSGTIGNCYTNFNVAGEVYLAGGFIGINEGDIYNCYSTGTINTSGAGAFCIINNGNIANCFWDKSTCNVSFSSGGLGKTGTEMRTLDTFTDAGWDFVGETVNGTDDIWQICDGMNYPRLVWEEKIAGDIVCPDGVGLEDFAVVAGQWGLPVLEGDVWPDGVVNILDFARMGAGWLSVSGGTGFDEGCDISPAGGDGTVGVDDLGVIAGQWLGKSIYSGDISPDERDNVVDVLDLAVIAENWLVGR